MKRSYDVVVAGGGAAGVMAAIQAGRAGASTLLVEKTGMLGGTTTNGGVDFPGLFHAWGEQVIAGIGWELVTQTVRECGGELPDFTNYHRSHAHLHVRVNVFVYASLCDDAVVEAGVDPLFHTMLADLRRDSDGDGWDLTLCTKGGLRDVHAGVLVDCSGDANAAALAGLPLHRNEELQPGTLSCHASGYNVHELDMDAINAAFETEVQAGQLAYTDASWDMDRADVGRWLRKHGNNASHTHGIDARDSEGRTAMELASRAGLLRLYRFLRRQPGLQHLVIEHVSPECGVRETVTIVGKKRVTVEDYTSGRQWEDALCYAFYPVDLHSSSGSGLRCEPLQEGVVPTVPRGALLPQGSHNFIVAGRCLASDQLANSALRVQASAMATGQAAGAMAALSAASGLDPEKLALGDVRDLLRKHNAIVPRV